MKSVQLLAEFPATQIKAEAASSPASYPNVLLQKEFNLCHIPSVCEPFSHPATLPPSFEAFEKLPCSGEQATRDDACNYN